MAATHAASRLAARLEHLSHAALVELCALACTLDAHDSRTAADAALARHDPLPTWAVDDVLLSSDLAPRVMEKLEVKDGAAAAVCRAWRTAWEVTRKQRRWLHSAQLATPDFEMDDIRGLTALPGDRLCIATKQTLHIVDKEMHRLRVIGEEDAIGLAAGDTGLYVTSPPTQLLRRYDQESFELLAEYRPPEQGVGANVRFFCELALAPGRLLFAVAVVDNENRGRGGEVVAFNALTLERRHTIGHALFMGDNYPNGLAVIGQELYVGDQDHCCLHVFSFNGDHLREVRGDWGMPHCFCFIDDRIYLIEVEDGDRGRRVVVLTPEGGTLQVYKPGEVGLPVDHEIDNICHFDGKLLVSSSCLDEEIARIVTMQGV